MRRFLPFAGFIFFLAAPAAFHAQDKNSDPLAANMNLPGSFHPYNVNMALTSGTVAEEDKNAKNKNYSTQGKYHCLISEYDLDPVVMLFARGLDDNMALPALLQNLDALIDRNNPIRLRAFIVFHADDLTNVVAQDDKRDEMIAKLERLIEDAKLRFVVVTIAGKADLEKYPVGDGLTAVLYRKLRIVATHRVAADKLDSVDAPGVKAILTDVTEKFGARP